MSEHEVASTDEKWVRFWNCKHAWKEKQANRCDLGGYSGTMREKRDPSLIGRLAGGYAAHRDLKSEAQIR